MGVDALDNIPEFIYRLYSGEKRFAFTKWDKSEDYSIETKVIHDSPQAFVNIIKGCDKFCSYCVVPFTRGREKSRKLKEVVKDVRRLVEYSGVQEITLLGQNVNSYGKENGESLAELITALDSIEGLILIRYTTSHPYDVSDDLISVHGSSHKLSRHLHLPVQSGSDTVLKRMLREYTVEHYLNLLEKLRKARSDIVLSTDIIAGFPNETDNEHQETISLLDRAKFDFIYAYTFSSRAGTKASRIKDFLTEDIKKARLHEIQRKQLSIQEKIRKSMEGEVFRILIDNDGVKKGISHWTGRTNCNRIVHVPKTNDDNLKWHWADAYIESATALSCRGRFVRIHGRYPPSSRRDSSLNRDRFIS